MGRRAPVCCGTARRLPHSSGQRAGLSGVRARAAAHDLPDRPPRRDRRGPRRLSQAQRVYERGGKAAAGTLKRGFLFYKIPIQTPIESRYSRTRATEMKKLLLAANLGSLAFGQDAPRAKTADSWAPLRFLIGTWEAKTQG